MKSLEVDKSFQQDSFFSKVWKDSWKQTVEKLYALRTNEFYEAVAGWCSRKMVLLTISQNLQENNRAKVSFLIKLHGQTHFKNLAIMQ